MYQAMRSAGLNAADLMTMYNAFWNQWSEALYNTDGMGYATTGRFDMAYGDKKEIYKYFYKFRGFVLCQKSGQLLYSGR